MQINRVLMNLGMSYNFLLNTKREPFQEHTRYKRSTGNVTIAWVCLNEPLLQGCG